MSVSGIDLLGVMYRKLSLAHENIHEEFGGIKTSEIIIRVDTATLPVS